MRMRVLSERCESTDLSASVFNGLRTLSFSVDKRSRLISFRISRLRTLLENMGGVGTLTSKYFKYYFKRLSPGRDSSPACPEPSRRERAHRVKGSCSFPFWNSPIMFSGSLRRGAQVALAVCLIPLLASSLLAQQKVPLPAEPRIEVYESSEDLHETLQEKPPLAFGVTRGPHLTITINDAVKYQQIDGFGASLTDSSAWLLWNKLTEGQRKANLEMLFSPTTGIGLSVLRQPMGASDFALSAYSYDDLPPGGSSPNLPSAQSAGQTPDQG